jgi:hypothetical protein
MSPALRATPPPDLKFVCLLVVTDLVIVTVEEPPSKLVRSVISVSEKPYFVNQIIIAQHLCYKMHNFKAVDHKKKRFTKL